MQIELDEIKRYLNIFIESDTPFISLGELGLFEAEPHGPEYNKTIFYVLILLDNAFISDALMNSNDPEAVGLRPSSEIYSPRAVPIRLTQKGHDFAKLLNQKPIFEKLKKAAQEAPFKLLFSLGKSISLKLVEKQLGL